MNNSVKSMTSYLERGSSYERQVRNYLAIQPDCEQVWLWKDTPERVLEEAGIIKDFDKQRIKRKQIWDSREHHVRDTGVDIVVKSLVQSESTFHLVQAKCYTDHKVNQDDLAGFFRHLLVTDLNGTVYSNSEFQTMLLLDDSDRIDYKQFDYIEQFVSPDAENDVASSISLRPYQSDAIEKLTLHFQSEKRAILSLPCGTGKTIIAAKVTSGYNIVIVISPYCAHADQNLDRFSELLSDHAPLAIHHDEIRDIQKIQDHLKKHNKVLISATMKSADLINIILRKMNLKSSMIVIDEFHHLGSSAILDKSNPLNQILCSDIRILHVSATARIFDLENRSDEDLNTTRFFGNLNVSMSLSQAIEAKYVTDYKVYIPLIGEVGDEKKCALEISLNDVDERLLSKALFLIKCMLFEAARKTIVFLQSKTDVDTFYYILSTISRNYFGIDLSIGRIVSETTASERMECIKEFIDSDEYAVLLNIRILGECLDIAECDSVYFADSCASKINCVQRLSRATRINPHQPNKIARIFLWSDADSDLSTFVSSVKEINPEFATKLTAVSKKYSKRTSAVKLEEHHQSQRQYRFAINVQEYKYDILERAKSKAQAYVDFVRVNKRHPRQKAEDPFEDSLAYWLNNYKQGKLGRNEMIIRPEVEIILDETGWRDIRSANVVENQIAAIKKQIEETGRAPAGHEDPLANWISRQKSLANNKKLKSKPHSYKQQLDEVFGEAWRDEDENYWKEYIKAESLVNRIYSEYEGKMPPSGSGKGQSSTDYTLIADYRAKMKYGIKKNKKPLRPQIIKLFREKIPHLIPTVEESLPEYRCV